MTIICKYRRTWYFLQSGFNVFLYTIYAQIIELRILEIEISRTKISNSKPMVETKSYGNSTSEQCLKIDSQITQLGFFLLFNAVTRK